MLAGPSSLANIVYLIGDTLDADYGIDPTPVYRDLGIDPDGPADRGDRVLNTLVHEMWDRADALAQDPSLGIKVGLNLGVKRFPVLKHSWLAAENLLDAIERQMRYEDILDSGITDLQLVKEDDLYVISESYPNPTDYPGKLQVDMAVASVVNLSRMASNKPIGLRRLEVYAPEGTDLGIYADLVDGPITLSDERNALCFSAQDVEEPLRGAVPEIIDTVTQIAEDYLRTFDTSKVAYRVRELLVQMLPSGPVDQETIADKLYRSASTLQRQLGSEGTSYREILSDTREQMAKGYLKEHKYSHAQIAFLLGFSDQSNFSRAFKRWTGQSPGQYQKAG